jgi:hypothetical protein
MEFWFVKVKTKLYLTYYCTHNGDASTKDSLSYLETIRRNSCKLAFVTITWLCVLHPYCSICPGETEEAVYPCHQLLDLHSYIPLSDM